MERQGYRRRNPKDRATESKRSGLPIGTWIDKIILEQQAQVSRNDSNLLNSEEQNALNQKSLPPKKLLIFKASQRL